MGAGEEDPGAVAAVAGVVVVAEDGAAAAAGEAAEEATTVGKCNHLSSLGLKLVAVAGDCGLR